MFNFHKCPNHEITKSNLPKKKCCRLHSRNLGNLRQTCQSEFWNCCYGSGSISWRRRLWLVEKMFIFTFKTDHQGTIMHADPLVKSLPLLRTQAYFRSSLLSIQKVMSANPSRSTFLWRRTLLANHNLALKGQELTRKNSRKIVSFRVEWSDDQKYVCARRLLLSNRLILTKY